MAADGNAPPARHRRKGSLEPRKAASRRTTQQRQGRILQEGVMHKTALFLAVTAVLTGTLAIEADAQTRRERFQLRGQPDAEANATTDSGARTPAPAVTEAPTGFDNVTNGFLPQGDPFETIDEDNVVPLRSFND